MAKKWRAMGAIRTRDSVFNRNLSIGANTLLIFLGIVLFCFGVLYLVRPDIIAEFENNHSLWGKSSTPKQKELTSTRLNLRRLSGFGMFSGGIFMCLIQFGLLPKNTQPNLPRHGGWQPTSIWVDLLVFISFNAFVVMGLLMMFKPEEVNRFHRNNNQWQMFFGAQIDDTDTKESFWSLLPTRLMGCLFVGFMVFFLLLISGVIK